ncbi:MAG TPA: carboxypeptidase regulatory-like domain-containing protein [Bryobacteraceae bacterium]|jgi:hypothetical protein|nr:carboxypeptidase regulatory-like domain-containing protein [Bryobacteraceae bacterium]
MGFFRAGPAAAGFMLFVALAPFAFAQTASVSGRVVDESGAYVPSARVTLTPGPPGEGKLATATAGPDGVYTVTGLTPGSYSIVASAPALSMQPLTAALKPGPQTIDLRLRVAAVTTQIDVGDVAGTVTVESSSNASATVLSGNDLDSLSDDPQDLQSDLEALAGPAAGPGGNAIFIDGFSGGELPAKESIREVRVNQNPFSPEFDKMGLGRIEVFTKPGTDKYHGTVGYNLGTDKWNSRNPYSGQQVPFLLQESENSFSGPLSKRSSFTLSLERQAVNNGSVTNAIVVDPSTFNITPFSSVQVTRQRHLRVGPHVDYQINDNNYLSLRYTNTIADIPHAGIGSFDLISRGYHLYNTFNTVQAIETFIHGSSVNEVRFQYFRHGTSTTADTDSPALQVLGSFNGGGASSLHTHDVQPAYEFQNNTTMVHGLHTARFGVRLREGGEDSYLPQNFNGSFTFTSADQYQQTLRGMHGFGPSQFNISTGIPALSIQQYDVAVFAGDEWRLRPNFTVNLGARYEAQTNVRAGKDFAPRVGIAWAPGATGNKTSKTVLRAGFGVFYDRFSLSNTLAADRYNGLVQQQYVIVNPTFFPNIPSLTTLAALPTSTLSTREVDSHLQSPMLMQSAFTVERQLPKKSTLAVTYTNSHGIHEFISKDINAPLAGVYPYPGKGPVFLMTSSGIYNQNQLIANFNMRWNAAVSATASYVLNKALSNTDGLGTYPGNPYNYAGEYGPASSDIRHRVSLSGSFNMRGGIRLNPLVSFQTGAPYNITTGTDPYGTTLYTARPGVTTDASRPGVIQTPEGLLDPNPLPGETLLGRNAGRGPGQVMVNLRVSRLWGFGGERKESPASARGVFAPAPANRRYNVSLGMSVRNILNHNNQGPIIGNINSPLFGLANQVAGGPNGEGFSENASNRRLELQLRFIF